MLSTSKLKRIYYFLFGLFETLYIYKKNWTDAPDLNSFYLDWGLTVCTYFAVHWTRTARMDCIKIQKLEILYGLGYSVLRPYVPPYAVMVDLMSIQ